MNAAVIVAGGKGRRMGGDTPKQYLPLAGRPILAHTLAAFDACPDIHRIVLAVPAADVDYCRHEIAGPLQLRCPVTVTAGGAERQESVYNGLTALEGGIRVVAIHDGVRPFASPDLISAVIREADHTGAAIAAMPAVDTLKIAGPAGRIASTLDRDRVWLAQTPQAFQWDLIWNAHEAARRDGILGTDDAALAERLGHPVALVTGERFNLKITLPEDLILAKFIRRHLSGGTMG